MGKINTIYKDKLRIKPRKSLLELLIILVRVFIKLNKNAICQGLEIRCMYASFKNLFLIKLATTT